MEDFNGEPKPPAVGHQPFIENQVPRKVYGASVGQCRPIAYLLVIIIIISTLIKRKIFK